MTLKMSWGVKNLGFVQIRKENMYFYALCIGFPHIKGDIVLWVKFLLSTFETEMFGQLNSGVCLPRMIGLCFVNKQIDYLSTVILGIC